MKTATDLIAIMHKSGKAENPEQPFLAVMTGEKSCKAKGFDMEFDEDDLIFLERQTIRLAHHVMVTKGTHEDKGEGYNVEMDPVPNYGGPQTIDNTDYNKPLHSGDTVVLIPVNDKYLVLGRVVMT